MAAGPTAPGGRAISPRERNVGLTALIGSTSIALVGQFMISPLLIFDLNTRGFSASQIGLFSTSVWFGILLTTPFASQIVQRVGAKVALIHSLSIPFATLCGMLLTSNVLIWSALYFLAGVAMSLRWIVAEACVAELAPDKRRGRIVGLYQMLIGIAFVAGPALLAWMGPTNSNAPKVALAFLFVGLLITLLVPNMDSAAEGAEHHVGLRGIYQAANATPLVVVAGFSAGFFELGISTMLPIYGLAIGFSAAVAALLISVAGAGSSLVMMPLGEAADRFSPRRVALSCSAVTLVASTLLPLVPELTTLAWPLAFVWGAAGGALYTLAMIEIGHARRGVALISATSLLVLSYTMGSLVGPVTAGYAIELSVRWALASAYSLVAAVSWFLLARLWALPGSGEPGRN